MIELLLPYAFDTLEYSWVKVAVGIYMLADYSVAKERQQAFLVSLPGKLVNSIYL
jgi:hypothetical protein